MRCRQTDDNNLHITDLQKEEHKTFIFPEAIFTAVTAYQNQLVSEIVFAIVSGNSTNFVTAGGELDNASANRRSKPSYRSYRN